MISHHNRRFVVSTSAPKTAGRLAAIALALSVSHAIAAPILPNDNSDFVIDATTSTTLTGGATTAASPVVTVDNTAGLAPGDAISGTGIPPGATILTVDTGTQVTISSNATADGAGLSLTTSSPATPINPGTSNLNTLTVTDESHRIIDIGGGNTLRLGATGSITRDLAGDQRNRLTITSTGSLTAGGADNTAGNLHFDANSGVTGNLQRNVEAIVVNAPITNNGTAAVSVTKDGNQIVTLAGNNTYTGDTTVTQGILRSTLAGNLGSGDVYAQGNTASDSPAISLNGVGTYNNDFFIGGNGTQVVKNGGGWGALWMAPRAEVAGTVTLSTNTRITSMQNSSAAGATPAVISGKITGNFQLELGSPVNDNQGTLTISNTTNDWTGGTLINTGGTSGGFGVRINLGASEVIPHGAGKGDLTIRVNSLNPTATLDLNGHNETVNGLISISAR